MTTPNAPLASTRMARLLLVLAFIGFVAVAVPTAAQIPTPFFRLLPFHTGDRWDYVMTRYTATSVDSFYVEDLGVERWTVLEVNGPADSLGAVVRQERWGGDGAVARGALCRFTRRLVACPGCSPRREYLQVDVEHQEGRCTVPGLHPEGFRVSAGFGGAWTFDIGGQPHALASVVVNRQGAWPPVPGLVVDAQWNSGTEAGLLAMQWFRHEQGVSRQTQHWLRYAEVGGVRYGQVPTAVEAEPAGVTAFRLDGVYPNPFRDTFTLRLALPAAGPVHVEVFDLLGRRVFTVGYDAGRPGRHDLRLDGTPLAAGPYVVRVTTEAGRFATASVARAD